jgi:hypothetical protein
MVIAGLGGYCVMGLFSWLFGGRKRPTPVANPAFIAGALDIEYVSAIGVRSEGYIEAKYLMERKGKLILFGWYEQRQALRSFRVDRIAALTYGETGEIASSEDIRGCLIERALGDSGGKHVRHP